MWQIAAVAAMVLLAAYGIAVKQFFNDKHDWRAFIPLLLLAAVVLTAYYIYSGAQAEVKPDSYVFAAGLGVIFCLSTIASFIAIKDGQVGIVVPIFSLNLVIVAVAGMALFREPLTQYKIAGIILGLLSIILLTIESK